MQELTEQAISGVQELTERVLSYLRASWRYRWFGVAGAWVFALGGWLSVYRMPDSYEVSARVWVDTQSMVKNLLHGLTAQPNVNEIVGLISRTMTSRPNLEEVIRMANIQPETPEKMELLITRLTKTLIIQNAGDANFYYVAYADKDPQKALRVVQSLLAKFEEESLSNQRGDAEAARRFIDEEIKPAKEKLDAAENAVIELRRRQVLATGGKDYTKVIEAQTALSEATLELKTAQMALDAIKKNYSDETEAPSLLGEENTKAGGDPEIDAHIQALEQKLVALRINYTDQHPDVAALVRTINQLKEQQNVVAKLRRSSPTAPALDNGYRPVSLALATAEANVAAIKARVEEYRKRYDELKAAAIAAPQNEADYARLNREYEMAKSNYGTLLSRAETARITGEMEAKTRATYFRIIDPPRLPLLPKSPNRGLLNSVVLLMALAGGCGLAFVLSQIRPTFDNERRLREVAGLPVLGAVVTVWTDAQKLRRKRELIALLSCIAGLLLAYAMALVVPALTGPGIVG